LYTIPPPCLLSRTFRKTFRCINPSLIALL
jgi:hypothetical protein